MCPRPCLSYCPAFGAKRVFFEEQSVANIAMARHLGRGVSSASTEALLAIASNG
jgi:hypothetical protein